MTTGSVCESSLPDKKKTSGNSRNGNDYSNGKKKIEAMNQKTKGAPGRIECPCHNYTALSKIVDVVTSGDRSRTDSMIEWLNGSTDQVAIREKKLLTCGKRFKCRFRYGTSFAILRAIRDACAPFQAASPTTGDSGSTTSPKGPTNNDSTPFKFEKSSKKDESGPVSYDQSFPPLSQHPGASNILIPPSRKKHDTKTANLNSSNNASDTTTTVNTLKGRKKKPKRRIQLQPTTASAASLPSPLFAAATVPKVIDNPASKLDRGKISDAKNDKKDTEERGLAFGASGVMNSLRESKRDQPALAVFEAPSSFSSSLACNNPNATTKSDATKPTDQIISEPQKVDPTRTPSDSPSEVTDAAIEQMDRLVDIYIAMMKNMLVPSTPLEIHLLLELLLIDTDGSQFASGERLQRDTFKDSQKIKDDISLTGKVSLTGRVSLTGTGSTLFFQPIFYGPERCIAFAQSVMKKFVKGIIQRLSPFLVKSLLGDCVFVRRCPTVAEYLNRLLHESTTAIDWKPPTSESITGTHAIFSLPFEPDRDSRHNFKTQAEIWMYQNRELTRDAFLSQLRVFITAKSKVFLPREVDKVRETAQFESRKIINNVSSHNMIWFAQFFCDLLVQVGLAPVEEMDQELLQIVADDRDKLQKLHKRFFKKNPSRPSQSRASFGSSATTSHRNERYRHFNDHRNESKSSTAFQEALPYFPGYQEFFFIFLYSVNSYNFGIHLLHQVVKKTSDMISNRTLPGLEKRTLDLGLLARFLGCLIFSPNWHEENIDLNKLKPCIDSLDYGLNLLDAIGLPISKLVQESWDGGYTFLVVPWVTELLKMSKWDSISQSSMKFRQILANLRCVQYIASRSKSNEYEAYGSNMQQVFFHLETFFNGTFSLPKLTSLPDATLVPLSDTDEDSLDRHKIGLSKAAIYASSPHMENLCDMIMISKKVIRKDMKSPGLKPKKLKPSVVSPAVGKEAMSFLGIESPKGMIVPTSTSVIKREQLADNTLQGKRINAKNKLTEGFFHQHRELKEICDFVIQQTLKTLSVNEIRPFVTKASGEFSIGTQSTEAEIEQMETSAFRQSQDFLRKKLENKLTNSLELFCPADMQRRVIDIATNLSTDRGMEASHVIVRDFISSSTKSTLKQLEDTTPAPKHNGDKEKSDIDQATESATESIRNLTKNYSTVLDDNTDIKQIGETLGRVELVTKSVLIPSESVLRAFFECVLGLDSIAELVIDRVVKSSTPESWIALSTVFRLLEEVALVSTYWKNRLHNLFGDDLVNLISNCQVPSSSEEEKILKELREYSGKRATSSIAKDSDEDDSKYVGIINPKAIQFN